MESDAQQQPRSSRWTKLVLAATLVVSAVGAAVYFLRPDHSDPEPIPPKLPQPSLNVDQVKKPELEAIASEVAERIDKRVNSADLGQVPASDFGLVTDSHTWIDQASDEQFAKMVKIWHDGLSEEDATYIVENQLEKLKRDEAAWLKFIEQMIAKRNDDVLIALVKDEPKLLLDNEILIDPHKDDLVTILIARGRHESLDRLYKDVPSSNNAIQNHPFALKNAMRNQGSVEMLQWVVEHIPKSLNVIDGRGFTPITRAVFRLSTNPSEIDGIEYLLDLKPELVLQKDDEDRSVESMMNDLPSSVSEESRNRLRQAVNQAKAKHAANRLGAPIELSEPTNKLFSQTSSIAPNCPNEASTYADRSV